VSATWQSLKYKKTNSMDTTTTIYIVAAALILRVVIKVVSRYFKEQKNSDNVEEL
jgi:hypothetical protein